MSRVRVLPGGVLLLGVLGFALRPSEFAALLLAASVHELGHAAALRLLGVRMDGVTFAMTGPVLRCAAPERPRDRVLAALSGPAAGLGLWVLARSAWPLLAEISLLLSLLNLLPMLPLDGGRALFALLGGGTAARRALEILGLTLSLAISLAGLLAAASGYGVTLAVFGVWLLGLSCQSGQNDVS